MPGVYVACFSNEFSTFSHKLVYMDFQVGEDAPLFNLEDHATALTQMESSAQEIHKSLNSILDYQTHHRLREAQGKWKLQCKLKIVRTKFDSYFYRPQKS